MPKSPLTTIDLPIAGRSYSGGDSLGLIFDFVSLANNLVEPKQKRKERQKNKEKKEKETEDVDGQQTLAYLANVKNIAQRLSGKHPASLGLHPAVYFYGITGRYQPTAFLATIGLIQHFELTKGFNRFTEHRAKFEEFLLRHRYFTNQIVSQFGGRLKSYHALLSYYKVTLTAIASGKSFRDVAEGLQSSEEFRYLKERQRQITTRPEFSKAVETVTYVREAIKGAVVCKICHARISPRSVSYDHKKRKQDGGMGDPENVQLAHFYCNTTYKESGGGVIPPLALSLEDEENEAVK